MKKTNTKACILCACNLPDAALKCNECGSFQNWKRFIDFGNTFFALLIALLSLLTVLGNQISEFVVSYLNRPPDFKANVQIAELDDKQATVLVANHGSDSFISNGMHCQMSRTTLQWFDNADYTAWPLLKDIKIRTVYFYDAEPMLWKPGSSGLIKLKLSNSKDNRFAPQSSDEQKSICIYFFKDSDGLGQSLPFLLEPNNLVLFSVK